MKTIRGRVSGFNLGPLLIILLVAWISGTQRGRVEFLAISEWDIIQLLIRPRYNIQGYGVGHIIPVGTVIFLLIMVLLFPPAVHCHLT